MKKTACVMRAKGSAILMLTVMTLLLNGMMTSKVFADCTVSVTGSDNSDSSWGNTDASVVQLAQQVIPSCSGTISSVTFRVGSDEPNASYGGFFNIETDSGGYPSGTILGSTDVFAASDMTSHPGDFVATFSSPVSVTSGVTYWLVSDRVGSGGTGQFTWEYRASGSNSKIYDAGWLTSFPDLLYSLTVVTGGGGGGGGGGSTTTSATSSVASLAGDVTLGISILVFFAAMLFLGMVANVIGI